MTPERYNRAVGLFLEARQRDAPSRSSYLADACRDDPSLVGEVELLLAHDDPSSEFLPGSTGMGVASGRQRLFGPDESTAPPPATLGGYTILGVLGQGGMGVVYRAKQKHPDRTVALKVIRPGWVMPATVRRFEHESAALARLHHTGIAQVYEVGTFEDERLGVQPYFAMELVEGRPLTAFAADRGLTRRQRLELLVRVCRAVHHAHQRGIIHRDLKPANILVEEPGQPKVLDFGVARLADADAQGATLRTESGAVVGTLSYMSPEQAAGDPDEVDTRTDVYSLGAIAYELLAGRLPHDLAGLTVPESIRIVHDREPARLGALDRAMRGDLETIVAKALEKDRARRYQSAAELAEDIERFLRDEPIAARPASAWYQLGKFSRRHRGLVGGLAAAFLLLIAGVVGTSLALRRALRAESSLIEQLAETETARKAERARAEELTQVSEFQANMLVQVDPNQAGALLEEDLNRRFEAALVKAAIAESDRAPLVDAFKAGLNRINRTDAALELIDRTILRPAVDAIDKQFKDQPVVDAQLRQALADRYQDLGLHEAAMPLQTSALATRLRVLGEEHPHTIVSIGNMGGLLKAQGKFAEAEPYLRRALEVSRQFLGEEHRHTLASLSNMGILLRDQGRLSEAEPYYREALEKRRLVLGDDHHATLTSLKHMGSLLEAQGRLAEAERYCREALMGRRRVLGEEHPDTLNSVNHTGILLYSQGKLAEAEPYLREALEKRRRVLGEEHPDTLNSIASLGTLLRAQGKYAEAELYLCESLEKRRRVLGDEHPSTLDSITSLGVLLHTQGRLSEAEPLYREALEGNRRVLGDDHAMTLGAIGSLGALFYAQGKLSEAEPYFLEALEGHRRVLGDTHPRTLHLISNMGAFLQKAGRLSEAEQCAREALEARRRVLGEEHPQTLLSLNNMGGVLQGQGKLAEAESYFRAAIEGRRRVLGEEHPDTLQAINNAGALLRDQSRLAEGEEMLLPAAAIAEARLAPRQQVRVALTKTIAKLYEAWHKAEPGKGYDAKAAEWKAKLDAIAPPPEPAKPEESGPPGGG